jgi:hypothetical protein
MISEIIHPQLPQECGVEKQQNERAEHCEKQAHAVTNKYS